MAASLTQHSLHAVAEVRQHILGHKGLDGAGKAAAVDTAGAPPTQPMADQTQSQRHLLVGRGSGGDHVLQQVLGGKAGEIHCFEEGGDTRNSGVVSFACASSIFLMISLIIMLLYNNVLDYTIPYFRLQGNSPGIAFPSD